MREYINVDQRIHLLCQILAKVNRNFLTEKEDFSHSTLLFDALGRQLVSHWIVTKNGNLVMALDLDDFSFKWFDGSFQEIKKYTISGKTLAQIEMEVISGLEDIGLGKVGFPKKLKYTIPDYSFKDEPFQALDSSVVDKWIYYRNLANESCSRFLRHLMADDEIRIWPHHFDTGVYTEIDNKLGLGFGLASQDSLVNSPYFYMSGNLLSGELLFENLPKLKLGKWDIGEWNGAVLPISDLDQLPAAAKQITVDQFIHSTLNWYWHSSLK